MTIVGTISGKGTLVSHERETLVGYDITVRDTGGRKSAEGMLDGPPRALVAAANSPRAILRLTNGGELSVTVGFYDATTRRAPFKIVAAIEGAEPE